MMLGLHRSENHATNTCNFGAMSSDFTHRASERESQCFARNTLRAFALPSFAVSIKPSCDHQYRHRLVSQWTR